MMVGFGIVKGKLYRRAYRLDPGSPIREANGRVWHHLLDVDWDHSFSQFKYKDRSPNTTVLKATTDEAAEWALQSARASHVGEDLSPAEVNRALLLESSYSRYTAPAIRLILKLHATLSNDFRKWMQTSKGIPVVQEKNRIDCTFVERGVRTMVEFKIAYENNTQKAIREALGQILEYNYYANRQRHDGWLLILDVEPSSDDLAYVATLKSELRIPLSLGWRGADGFEFK